MLSIRWNWNWTKLLSYGEVVCFASAWAVGLAMAWPGGQPADESLPSRAFASTSDAPGIQARLAAEYRR